VSARDRSALAALLLLLVLATGARAGGSIVGATEPTQILNNLELVKVALDGAQTAATVVSQYATQLQQYQAQLANLQGLGRLPEGLTVDAEKALRDLVGYRGALQQLSGSLGRQQSAIEQRLIEARLSGRDWKTYVAAVAADVLQQKQRAIERLKYEGSLLEQVQSDYRFARDMQSQIPATVGQHQALQLMNAQMNRVVTQNAKLLEVVSATVSQQAEKDAREAEASTRSSAERDLLRQRREALEKRQRSFGGL
jgi:P-type conjugative transfer protein TrbJ